MIEANKDMIWFQGLLIELKFKQKMKVLYNDSQNAIHLKNNSTFITESIIMDFDITSLYLYGVLNLEKIYGRKKSTKHVDKNNDYQQTEVVFNFNNPTRVTSPRKK